MSDEVNIRISIGLKRAIEDVILFLSPDSKWHDDESPLDDAAVAEGYLRGLLGDKKHVE